MVRIYGLERYSVMPNEGFRVLHMYVWVGIIYVFREVNGYVPREDSSTYKGCTCIIRTYPC